MFRRFIYHNFPLTRIYIYIAKALYFFTTLVYGKKPRVIIRNNITYEVDLSEGTDLSLFLFGSFQKHVVSSELLNIPKDATIIDVGANFGLMSLPFAQLAPQGKVYAFEPAHYAIEKLKRNLSLNPELAKRIEVINAFVSAKSSEHSEMKAIASWKVNNENSEIHQFNMGAVKSAEGVPSISLNDFCQKENLARVDFIKMDTEGYESDVLKGSADAIARYRPQIIFEIGLYSMVERGIDFSFFSNYFEKLNYKMYDSASKAMITLANHKKYIPAKATIDIIAIPA